MTASKQHFEMIARVLRETGLGELDDYDAARQHEAGIVLQDRGRLAVVFAEELSRTNERFDRERFLKACGVEQ